MHIQIKHLYIIATAIAYLHTFTIVTSIPGYKIIPGLSGRFYVPSTPPLVPAPILIIPGVCPSLDGIQYSIGYYENKISYYQEKETRYKNKRVIAQTLRLEACKKSIRAKDTEHQAALLQAALKHLEICKKISKKIKDARERKEYCIEELKDLRQRYCFSDEEIKRWEGRPSSPQR